MARNFSNSLVLKKGTFVNMEKGFIKLIVNLIITIVIILIMTILFIFGVLVYQEMTGGNAIEQVGNFVAKYETIFDDMEDTENKTTPEIIETTKNEDNDVFNHLPSTPTTATQPTPTGTYVNDKYFYAQLGENSKKIYQALDQNKEQMKTGTAQINFGSAFSELLATEDGDKKLGEDYQSAIEAYLYDNPDIFYISANKLYLNIETTTRFGRNTYDVFINSGSQPNYFSDEFTSEEQVRQAIQSVEQVRNQILAQKTGNAYQDVKMVHDYLVDNIQYETTVSKDNIYNIYGALVNHESVCEGYAESFKYLLDGFDIPCVLVIGQGTNSQGSTENHEWNYVQLGSRWFAVDCTWDDPVIIGNGRLTNETKYKYFLKGENVMREDHTPSRRFTENGREYNYPTINVNNYS